MRSESSRFPFKPARRGRQPGASNRSKSQVTRRRPLLPAIRTEQQCLRICHVNLIANFQILNLTSILHAKRVLPALRPFSSHGRRRQVNFLNGHTDGLFTRDRCSPVVGLPDNGFGLFRRCCRAGLSNAYGDRLGIGCCDDIPYFQFVKTLHFLVRLNRNIVSLRASKRNDAILLVDGDNPRSGGDDISREISHLLRSSGNCRRKGYRHYSEQQSRGACQSQLTHNHSYLLTLRPVSYTHLTLPTSDLV